MNFSTKSFVDFWDLKITLYSTLISCDLKYFFNNNYIVRVRGIEPWMYLLKYEEVSVEPQSS